VLFGVNRLSVVAVAMRSDLEVCPHSRRIVGVRASYDIGFVFHWVGNYFLIDVILVFGACRLIAGNVLYRDVYFVANGTK